MAPRFGGPPRVPSGGLAPGRVGASPRPRQGWSHGRVSPALLPPGKGPEGPQQTASVSPGPDPVARVPACLGPSAAGAAAGAGRWFDDSRGST